MAGATDGLAPVLENTAKPFVIDMTAAILIHSAPNLICARTMFLQRTSSCCCKPAGIAANQSNQTIHDTSLHFFTGGGFRRGSAHNAGCAGGRPRRGGGCA